MAVPRNRTSNARKGSRRAHHFKKPINLTSCTNCETKAMPHRVCLDCGSYNGKQILKVEAE